MDDLWVLDPATGRWHAPKVAGPHPSARTGHALVAHGSNIILIGGSSPFEGPLGDVWLLHTAEEPMRWEHRVLDGATPAPRELAAVERMVVEGRACVAVAGGRGGEDAGTVLDDVWLLDLEHWTWRPTGARVRRCAAVSALCGDVWVIATGYAGGSALLADAIAIRVSTPPAEWSTCELPIQMRLPVPRFAAAGCALDARRLLVWGGMGLERDLDDLVELTLVDAPAEKP